MRMKKNYSLCKDKYYFTVKASPTNITISRSEKSAAVDAFMRYYRVGKEIEWLGKWDGKKFQENTAPSLEQVAN